MAVPQSKQELLDAIRKSYQQLMADLVNVPPERARESTLEGHAEGLWKAPWRPVIEQRPG
ncbi:ClbS/DfsB family four-helix bundle protein [Comamonas testosteroni]|uniref:ClbS/DfsB family four-helix bundle protein n=1 Tax=Comamonas testosteroni TaxID=285 RepID=UPI0015F9F864|nr:ClbS/DfsB family four-helix bundle protein [Comamonas testosteroni]